MHGEGISLKVVHAAALCVEGLERADSPGLLRCIACIGDGCEDRPRNTQVLLVAAA